MSERETPQVETVFWAVRHELPSRMTLALRKLRIIKKYPEPLPNQQIPVSAIQNINDDRLRSALEEQAQDTVDRGYVVYPVAFPDGRFSHAWNVRKGPTFGSRQERT